MGSNLVKLISVAHNMCWQAFLHSKNKHQQKALYRQADNHRTLWGIYHCIILTLWYYFLKRLLFSYFLANWLECTCMWKYILLQCPTFVHAIITGAITQCYDRFISLVDELIWIKLEHSLKLSKQLVLLIIQYFINYEMFEM